MNILTVNTAEQARDLAEETGITGPAQEIVIRAGARHRHEWRVGETIFAAHKKVAEICPPCQDSVLAGAFLIALDLHGVGGPLYGAGGGEGTARILTGLGKGRWQAMDGGAYRAAAIDALSRLCQSGGGKIVIDWKIDDDSQQGVWTPYWENFQSTSPQIPMGGSLRRWGLALAASILLTPEGQRSLALLGDETFRLVLGRHDDPIPTAWERSELFNFIHALE